MIAADQDTRDQALDIRGSFAVSAPAGSGKTALLIRRVLRLLATCEHPEQVLAITFTRKAAAEMHERLTEALVSAQDDSPPAEAHERSVWEDARRAMARDREKNWGLIAAPSRLRIMTIDGLARSLARQLALETGLGALPEPSEHPRLYYRQAIRGLFDELDKPGPEADALALLLAHLDNHLPRVEALLESLLARREQWLAAIIGSRDARDVLEAALEDTITETLAALRQQLQPVAGELADLADYAARNLEHLHIDSPLRLCLGSTDLPPATADNNSLTRWRGIADLLLTGAGDWRKKMDKRGGFPTARESVEPDRADWRKEQWRAVLARCRDIPDLDALLRDMRNLPAAAYEDDQWRLLEALTLLLPRLAGRLSLLFREQRTCDFTEITLAALQALGDDDAPTDLGLKLDYQIHHILVDEFQDTSSLQFRLLERLVAGWQPGDGRSLFIVGDGMQSLYGFRNANVGLFLEARQAPVNQVSLRPLDLKVNFRSDATVVDWINHCFGRVFPARQDISRGAVPYTPAMAARGDSGVRNDGDETAVTLDIFDQDSDGGDEARQVLARIQAARAREPGGSIAILARARSHLPPILAALYRAGIPWQATDVDPLATRIQVIDLLSLTRALLNPADRIAWLSLLRAPWCGLNLFDLHHLATVTSGNNPTADGERFPWLPGQILDPALWRDLSAEGEAIMARVGPVLRAAWHNRHRKPLRAWIEGTWLALGGPATLASPAEIAWCQQYFDLLEEHARGTAIRQKEAFEQAVASLYAAPEPAENPSAVPTEGQAEGQAEEQPKENAVQVMTIHKAKGLEFDTVIIPQLHRSGRGNDKSLLYWRERLNSQGESQLLIAPPLASHHGQQTGDALVNHLREEEKIKSRLEDARVLYVACTRAAKRLHLLFRAPAEGKGPATGSLLARLWPALADDPAAGGATVVNHESKKTGADSDGPTAPAAVTTLTRLVPDWRQPVVPDSIAVEPVVEAAMAAARSRTGWDAPDDNSLARHAGTVLHRTLRQIVLEGLDGWDHQRIARQRPVWQVQLRQLGVVPETDTLDWLAQSVSAALADNTGRWLLDNRHAHSACELALGYIDDLGRPATAVIDRTFIANGERWVVDYKSAAPAPEEPFESFIRRQREAYLTQMNRYRTLFTAGGQEQVRTALYFPLIRHLEVIDY